MSSCETKTWNAEMAISPRVNLLQHPLAILR